MRGVQIVKGKAFLVGLSSGVLLVVNWRPLLKGGVKTGLKVGSRVQRAAVRGAENIADVAHEARSELLLERLEHNAHQAAAHATTATTTTGRA